METDIFPETEISLAYFDLKNEEPAEDPLSLDEGQIKIEENNLADTGDGFGKRDSPTRILDPGLQVQQRIEVQKLPVFKLEKKDEEEQSADFETIYVDSEITSAESLDVSRKSSSVVIKPLNLVSPSKVVSSPTPMSSSVADKNVPVVSPSKVVTTSKTVDKIVTKNITKTSKNTQTPSMAGRCNLCDCYVLRSKLTFHKELHQSVPKLTDKATCTIPDCRSKNYPNHCSLQLHQQRHHNGREMENPILFLHEKTCYVCSICKAFFRTEIDFLKHCIPYTFFPQLICNCFECKIIFKSIDELKSHFLKVHKDHDAFKCRICGEGFRYFSGFSAHFEMHYTSRMHCIYCKKDMSVEAYLDEQNHIRKCFAKLKYCKCVFCDSVPKKPHKEHPDQLCNIIAHLQFHTSDPPMIYSHLCDICFNYFGSPSMLTAHKHTIHYLKEDEVKHKSNPKLKATFPCPKCDYLYDSKLQLSDHLTNVKHLQDKKTLECKICGKIDTKTSLMNRHISDFHQDELLKQNPERFRKISSTSQKKIKKKNIDTDEQVKKKKVENETIIANKVELPIVSTKKSDQIAEKVTKELTLEEKYDKMFGITSPKRAEQTELNLNSIADLSSSKLVELLPDNSNIASQQSEEVIYDPKGSSKTPEQHSTDTNRASLLKTLNPTNQSRKVKSDESVSEIPSHKVISDSEIPAKKSKLTDSEDISIIKIKPNISIVPVVDETSQNTPPPSKKLPKNSKQVPLFKKLMITNMESKRTKIPICDPKTNKTTFIVVDRDKPKKAWNVGIHVAGKEQSKNVTKSPENSKVVAKNVKGFQNIYEKSLKGSKKSGKGSKSSHNGSESSQKVSGNSQNGSESSRKVSGNSQKGSESSQKVSGNSQNGSESSQKVSGNSQNGSESSQKVSENSQNGSENSHKVSSSKSNCLKNTSPCDSSDSDELEVVFASIQIKCEKCNNIFQSKADLSKHLFIHYQTNDLIAVHQCKRVNCNQTFINYCSYKLHYKSVHERMQLKNPVLTPKERYQCEICFAFFTSEVTFAYHCFPYTVYWQLTNNCGVCYESFKTSEEFRLHREQEHPTSPDCVQCKICGLKMAQVTELTRHVPGHHIGYAKCDKCQLEFEANYYDSYHIDMCKKSVK